MSQLALAELGWTCTKKTTKKQEAKFELQAQLDQLRLRYRTRCVQAMQASSAVRMKKTPLQLLQSNL